MEASVAGMEGVKRKQTGESNVPDLVEPRRLHEGFILSI